MSLLQTDLVRADRVERLQLFAVKMLLDEGVTSKWQLLANPYGSAVQTYSERAIRPKFVKDSSKVPLVT